MVETTATKILYQIGTSRVFAFPIRFISPQDVKCYISVNDSERKLADSEYTIENKEDYSDGANVTLNIDPLPAGATLAIIRECAPLQVVSFPVNGKFPSAGNESALDRLTMICQDLYERISRALMAPVTAETDFSDLLATIQNSAAAIADLQNQLSDYALTLDQLGDAYRILQEYANTTRAQFSYFVSRFGTVTPEQLSELYDRLAPLTVINGDLKWNNCLVYNECNHTCASSPEGDNDPGAFSCNGGQLSSGISPTFDGGSLHYSIYHRNTSFRLFINTTEERGSVMNCYALGVAFDWNTNSATAFYRSYGKFTELDIDSETGEPMDDYPTCDHSRFASAARTAAELANTDISNYIDGLLYSDANYTGSEVAPGGGWLGYRRYRQSAGGGGSVSPNGQIETSTRTETHWYDIWGETPCDSQEGCFGEITVRTFVFHWASDSSNSGRTPVRLVLKNDRSGEIREYEFGKEYCLACDEDIDRSMLTLTTCDDNELSCPFVVTSGVLGADGSYQKPESIVSRTFTYLGVIYE